VFWAVLAARSNGAGKQHRAHPTPHRPDKPAPASVQPGSDPSVLPGPVLIADRGHNRLLEIDPYGRSLCEFPRPGDLPLGETFNVPPTTRSSAPTENRFIATQEDDFVISVIDVNSHRIVWR
jgi:hypothetical protein